MNIKLASPKAAAKLLDRSFVWKKRNQLTFQQLEKLVSEKSESGQWNKIPNSSSFLFFISNKIAKRTDLARSSFFLLKMKSNPESARLVSQLLQTIWFFKTQSKSYFNFNEDMGSNLMLMFDNQAYENWRGCYEADQYSFFWDQSERTNLNCCA